MVAEVDIELRDIVTGPADMDLDLEADVVPHVHHTAPAAQQSHTAHSHGRYATKPPNECHAYGNKGD